MKEISYEEMVVIVRKDIRSIREAAIALIVRCDEGPTGVIGGWCEEMDWLREEIANTNHYNEEDTHVE